MLWLSTSGYFFDAPSISNACNVCLMSFASYCHYYDVFVVHNILACRLKCPLLCSWKAGPSGTAQL